LHLVARNPIQALLLYYDLGPDGHRIQPPTRAVTDPDSCRSRPISKACLGSPEFLSMGINRAISATDASLLFHFTLLGAGAADPGAPFCPWRICDASKGQQNTNTACNFRNQVCRPLIKLTTFFPNEILIRWPVSLRFSDTDCISRLAWIMALIRQLLAARPPKSCRPGLIARIEFGHGVTLNFLLRLIGFLLLLLQVG
jgi:hypothetical protein